jgi:hypothetical protein
MMTLIAAAAVSAALDVSAVRAPYARARIPVAADPGPDRDYRDLRVRDDRGGEIPYALDPHPALPPATIALRSAGFERPADAPAAQGATSELPASNLDVTALRIDTSTPSFERDVLIERSDDGDERWRADVASAGRVVTVRRDSSGAAAALPAVRLPAGGTSDATPAWLVPVAFGWAVVVLGAFALRLTRMPETTGSGSE